MRGDLFLELLFNDLNFFLEERHDLVLVLEGLPEEIPVGVLEEILLLLPLLVVPEILELLVVSLVHLFDIAVRDQLVVIFEDLPHVTLHLDQ